MCMTSYLLLDRVKVRLQNTFLPLWYLTVCHLSDLFLDGQHYQPESHSDWSKAKHSVRVLRHGHKRQED